MKIFCRAEFYLLRRSEFLVFILKNVKIECADNKDVSVFCSVKKMPKKNYCKAAQNGAYDDVILR